MKFDVINPVSVGKAFLEILAVVFSHYDQTKPPSHEEKEVAEELFRKLAKMSTTYKFVEENVNEFGPEENIPSCSHQPSDIGTSCSEEKDPTYEVEDFCEPQEPTITIKQKAKVIQMIDDHPNWSFKSIHGKYPYFKNKGYYSKWKMQIQNGATKPEVFFEIDKSVLKMFKEIRQDKLSTVHDMDLRRWAIQRAAEFPGIRSTFKASKSWIASFKKRHRISSRKVTKVVKKRNQSSLETVLENVENFRAEIQALQSEYELCQIYNTDQIGFNLEYTGIRTLSFTGENITYASGFSPTNKLTHSITAQLIISADGGIVGPLFLCLQEPTGRLGETVKKTLFQAPNLCITCSKSGKLTKSLSTYFFEKVAKPNITGKALYILDSWSGHLNLDCYDEVGQENGFCVKVIPKNGTAFAQPLDVYFNRQYKYFVRRFKEYANQIDRDTGNRNSTLKLHSLAHFLLSAPVFKEMIRYSWRKSGLLKSDAHYFYNMKDACFQFKEAKCMYESCSGQSFIKCAWCDKVVCFGCFFDECHASKCENRPNLFRN